MDQFCTWAEFISICLGAKGNKEMTYQKGSYEVKNHGVSEEKKNARTYGGGVRLEWGRRGKLEER